MGQGIPTCFYYLCFTKAISSPKLVSTLLQSQLSKGKGYTVQGQSVMTSKTLFKKKHTQNKNKKTRAMTAYALQVQGSGFNPQDHKIKTSNHLLLKGICCFFFPTLHISIINCGVLSYCFLLF